MVTVHVEAIEERPGLKSRLFLHQKPRKRPGGINRVDLDGLKEGLHLLVLEHSLELDDRDPFQQKRGEVI